MMSPGGGGASRGHRLKEHAFNTDGMHDEQIHASRQIGQSERFQFA